MTSSTDQTNHDLITGILPFRELREVSMENFRWVEHAHVERSFLLSYSPVPNLAYALLVVANTFRKLPVFCLQDFGPQESQPPCLLSLRKKTNSPKSSNNHPWATEINQYTASN